MWGKKNKSETLTHPNLNYKIHIIVITILPAMHKVLRVLKVFFFK